MGWGAAVEGGRVEGGGGGGGWAWGRRGGWGKTLKCMSVSQLWNERQSQSGMSISPGGCSRGQFFRA